MFLLVRFLVTTLNYGSLCNIFSVILEVWQAKKFEDLNFIVIQPQPYLNVSTSPLWILTTAAHLKLNVIALNICNIYLVAGHLVYKLLPISSYFIWGV